MGAWEGLIRFAKELALPHNMAPSLHVALSVVCVAVYVRRAPAPGAVLLWAWSFLIAASTVLLHQHYLIDVLTGYALGWAAVRLVYDRLCGAAHRMPSSTKSAPPAAPHERVAVPSSASGSDRRRAASAM
jgi:hypothetical protein